MQSHQNLVFNPQVGDSVNSVSQQLIDQSHALASANPNLLLLATGGHQQLTATQVTQLTTGHSNSMAALVARLMSLNANELQLLNSDCDLMRHLSETQLLLESRLHQFNLRAKLSSAIQQQQQLHQHQYHYANSIHSPTSSLTPTNQSAQNDQQMSSAHQVNFYQDYYARAAQFAAEQQLLMLANQHQQHHHLQQDSFLRPATQSSAEYQVQLALDLRTSSAGQASDSSSQESPSDQRRPPTAARLPNHKKLKLDDTQQPAAQTQTPDTTDEASEQSEQNSAPSTRTEAVPSPNATASSPVANISTTTSSLSPSATIGLNSTLSNTSGNSNQSTGKKYKGEFDEPSPAEVEQRQRALATADNYHSRYADRCACVLGSQFKDRPVSAVLEMIDKWRQMDVESRIKLKWDVADLPKDIPLSEIKKFEDLRREVSNGRADFGGASKRKPLGIRGTRQFLMILYCLWGHPGRDDPMQREGYCPHCFAKIKKANEQSTLVRVVNHFNMKHRKGANPRLSPHRDQRDSETTSS